MAFDDVETSCLHEAKGMTWEQAYLRKWGVAVDPACLPIKKETSRGVRVYAPEPPRATSKTQTGAEALPKEIPCGVRVRRRATSKTETSTEASTPQLPIERAKVKQDTSLQ